VDDNVSNVFDHNLRKFCFVMPTLEGFAKS